MIKYLFSTTFFLIHIFEVFSQCEPLVPESNRYGYRDRGGRCEGLYKPNVSGFTLQVVSFTQGEISYVLNDNEKLKISSAPGLNLDMFNVRGVNFSMDINYRLDMALEPGKTVEIPVKDVIQPIKLKPEDFGLFGFVEKFDFRYYVPVVQKSQLSNQPKNNGNLIFKIQSNIDISEVTWQYAVSKNEFCRNYSDPITLPKKNYSRKQPIEIPLPESLLASESDQYVCIQVSIKGLNGLEFHENIRLMLPKP